MKNSGMTLVEVAVACALLTIVIFEGIGFMILTNQGKSYESKYLKATQIAGSSLEDLTMRDLADPLLVPGTHTVYYDDRQMVSMTPSVYTCTIQVIANDPAPYDLHIIESVGFQVGVSAHTVKLETYRSTR